jgi:hypothetical protein
LKSRLSNKEPFRTTTRAALAIEKRRTGHLHRRRLQQTQLGTRRRAERFRQSLPPNDASSVQTVDDIALSLMEETPSQWWMLAAVEPNTHRRPVKSPKRVSQLFKPTGAATAKVKETAGQQRKRIAAVGIEHKQATVEPEASDPPRPTEPGSSQHPRTRRAVG